MPHNDYAKGSVLASSSGLSDPQTLEHHEQTLVDISNIQVLTMKLPEKEHKR